MIPIFLEEFSLLGPDHSFGDLIGLVFSVRMMVEDFSAEDFSVGDFFVAENFLAVGDFFAAEDFFVAGGFSAVNLNRLACRRVEMADFIHHLRRCRTEVQNCHQRC